MHTNSLISKYMYIYVNTQCAGEFPLRCFLIAREITWLIWKQIQSLDLDPTSFKNCPISDVYVCVQVVLKLGGAVGSPKSAQTLQGGVGILLHWAVPRQALRYPNGEAQTGFAF